MRQSPLQIPQKYKSMKLTSAESGQINDIPPSEVDEKLSERPISNEKSDTPSL
jgi:hypothetical protein